MLLSEVARGIGRREGPDADVLDVQHDSREVAAGDLYCAVEGQRFDGHSFIPEALARGAAAICARRAQAVPDGVPSLIVPDVRAAMGPLSARVHGHPSERLDVYGVTGTNGKTTTTYLLRHVLRGLGRRVDLIGTVERTIGGRTFRSKRTTPEATDLQRWFAAMLREGTEEVVMEVSSHALDLGRVDGVHFTGAVFTNLTQDHLDYHRTMEGYLRAKLQLFQVLDADAFGVVNRDDPHAADFLGALRGRAVTFGLAGPADLVARDVQASQDGTTFVCRVDGRDVPVELRVAGDFNVHNALAALSVAWAGGYGVEDAARQLRSATAPPGRFEHVVRGQPFAVIVDYAHTPDGIEKLLRSARRITPGRVMLVFGCGGERDRGKRPQMGRIAGELADLVMVTSDNPRSEDPKEIVRQVTEGIRAAGRTDYLTEIDRSLAIRRVIQSARAGDTVLIAGKGHETYQIIGDDVQHWSDQEEAARALEERG